MQEGGAQWECGGTTPGRRPGDDGAVGIMHSDEKRTSSPESDCEAGVASIRESGGRVTTVAGCRYSMRIYEPFNGSYAGNAAHGATSCMQHRPGSKTCSFVCTQQASLMAHALEVVSP